MAKERWAFSRVCFSRHSHATSMWVWPTTLTVTSVSFLSMASSALSFPSAVPTVS